MLSILIPEYNYNVYPLVLELHKQCLDCEIEFEIIVIDDYSNELLPENEKINTLSNCSFEVLSKNLGRSVIRNLLAQKAKFEYLLFLDADTFPTNNKFIFNYLNQINANEIVVFGGIQYQKESPEKESLLRWIYGNKRESLSAKKRNKKPHTSALVSNLLIQRDIIMEFPFDSEITNYGYEDLCFLSVLKNNDIKVSHIENPTFHLNLETSIIFLEKTKIALDNLAFITNSRKFNSIESKINSAYINLRKLKLVPITALIFKKTESIITSNLLSKKPSLFLFDIYKLGYYCSIKQNKNAFFLSNHTGL
jgi:glycosyltransferase involved in cell wall biosynthesis